MTSPMDPNDPRWDLSGLSGDKPERPEPPRWAVFVMVVTLLIIFGAFFLPVLIYLAQYAWGLVVE